ncbi:hypothetical protein ACFY5F_36090 [Streptomyces sp. NPDC013161]|uniref:hypothetical protein n=1 Tax=Streptomyces sp. NPDC013161 TaxID=3364862 RepID=UPI0036AAF19A
MPSLASLALALRPGRGRALLADVPAFQWAIPTLAADEPNRQAYQLLGPAWRSSTPTVISTGSDFDVVQVPQQYATVALDRLRSISTRGGAVYADGDDWRFFVPPGARRLPWPAPAVYLSGPALLTPPRGARGRGPGLRWITRGEPSGQLLWPQPTVLSAALMPPVSASVPPRFAALAADLH